MTAPLTAALFDAAIAVFEAADPIRQRALFVDQLRQHHRLMRAFERLAITFRQAGNFGPAQQIEFTLLASQHETDDAQGAR